MDLKNLLLFFAGLAMMVLVPVLIFGGERIRRGLRLVLRLSIYSGDYTHLYVVFFASLGSILFTLKEVRQMGLDTWMVCGAITALAFSAIYLYFQSYKSYSKVKMAAESLKSSLDLQDPVQIKEASIGLLNVLEEKLLAKEKPFEMSN